MAIQTPKCYLRSTRYAKPSLEKARDVLNFASANQETDKVPSSELDTLSKVFVEPETTDEQSQRLKEIIAKHTNVFQSKNIPLG